MYETIFPVTHHFYPLQNFTDPDKPPFSDFLNNLTRPKSGYNDNLLYLHIPYCEKRCIFCPFHVRVRRDDAIYERYVRALETEIHAVSALEYISQMRFSAVYFGGGSPSLLSLEHVKRLYYAVRQNFNIDANAEWTFEGEPNGLSDKKLLDYLANQGTRRLSYGIQTFDEKLRETLNISATVDDVLTCFERAKEIGFDEVNVDMMFHLPGQTIEALDEDLSQLAKHGFDSIDYYYMSYYGLPKSAFVGMEKGTFPRRPPLQLRSEMNKYISRRLLDLGYNHVTDHVFSKKLVGSDYYRILWGGGFGEHRAETVGIGASARGYVAGYSYANENAHDTYMEQIEQGRLPISKVSDRLRDERNRGMVFFPKFFRVSSHRIPDDKNTISFIANLIKEGLATEQTGSIVLTESGKEWIPNITADLFEPEQRAICDLWLTKLNSHYSNRVTLWLHVTQPSSQ